MGTEQAFRPFFDLSETVFWRINPTVTLTKSFLAN